MFTKSEGSIEIKYQEGLRQVNENARSDEAKEDIMNFYNEHQDICDRALKYYQEYEEYKSNYVKEPKRITSDEFCKVIKSKTILLLTANPIERGVLLRWLSEKHGAPLDTYMVKSFSYNLLHINDKISIIHTSPGMTGDEYTRKLINKTCELFTPNCICSIGICYGFNRKKHSIGSVFLSESVTSLRMNFRDSSTSEDVSFEAEIEIEDHPSYSLIQSIKSRLMYTMSYSILSDVESPTIVNPVAGKFLSLNSLVSHAIVKKALMDQYGKTKPKPLGGEMEGSGILKADIVQDNEYNRWLIIKSICDWGEMKNEISESIKDSLQAFAMSNSCGVFEKIINDLCEV